MKRATLNPIESAAKEACVFADLVAPKPRGRPRSEQATLAVLEAAYALTAANGLRGATMQAIAEKSGVSRVTIYKWWDGRLPLLIDAYMHQATLLLPLMETGCPVKAIRAHALRYLEALQGDLGRVQIAVLAECLAENGNSALFVQRYLHIRRTLGVAVIRKGQLAGSIRATRPATALYDQIYGTIFYRYQFGLLGMNRAFVGSLVKSVLLPAGSKTGASQARVLLR